jgi:hypothetical protein
MRLLLLLLLRLLLLLLLLLLQSALQPLVGFRPAHLSLSILSRKVFTECRSNFRHKRPPASEATPANPAAESGTMGEKWQRNFAESGDFHVAFGFFYMP